MSKFEDYEASHITPQKTLLKKFNEVLKFLKNEDSVYRHKLTFSITLENFACDLEFSIVNFRKEPYLTYDQLLEDDRMNFLHSINASINDHTYRNVFGILYRPMQLNTSQKYAFMLVCEHIGFNTPVDGNYLHIILPSSFSDEVEEL